MNKNAYNTIACWIQKLFVLVDSIQEDVILEGNVNIDEMYYPEINGDKTIIDGKQPRDLSKNQYCIAVGYGRKHVFACLMGKGKPSGKRVWNAYGSHIAPGSILIHDMEMGGKKLKDKDNPLEPINRQHNLLKKFLNSHSGFDHEDLPHYLNLYCLCRILPGISLKR